MRLSGTVGQEPEIKLVLANWYALMPYSQICNAAVPAMDEAPGYSPVAVKGLQRQNRNLRFLVICS